MSWFNFAIKDIDGSRYICAKVNDITRDISEWSVKREVERELVRHFVSIMIDKFSDEIVKDIRPDDLMKMSNDGFKEVMKEKFKQIGSITFP